VKVPSTRALGASDIADFRSLLALFSSAFDDREAYLNAQPDDEYLRRLLASDAFIAVASFEGPSLTGGLTAYVLPKFEQARTEIYIYDLAVDEQHRRQGIATALVTALKKIATERGAYVIYVQADQVDAAAIALYAGLGVGARVMHFDILPLDTKELST
jgi:aminoglycoside 3-N-acetyltransferase I